MKTNIKLLLTSLASIVIAVGVFILFMPLFIFIIAFIIIFYFVMRRKIIKNNPEFFQQFNKNKSKNKKGRIIDQEEDTFSNNNKYDKNLK